MSFFFKFSHGPTIWRHLDPTFSLQDIERYNSRPEELFEMPLLTTETAEDEAHELRGFNYQ